VSGEIKSPAKLPLSRSANILIRLALLFDISSFSSRREIKQVTRLFVRGVTGLVELRKECRFDDKATSGKSSSKFPLLGPLLGLLCPLDALLWEEGSAEVKDWGALGYLRPPKSLSSRYLFCFGCLD
jgi:hypothetical protein